MDQGRGRAEGHAAHNEAKARPLYDFLDSQDFFRAHAEKGSRSLMNVTFRLPTEDLEKQFVKEATAAGLDGQGPPPAGGMRASIYNAFPRGVTALVAFMEKFANTTRRRRWRDLPAPARERAGDDPRR